MANLALLGGPKAVTRGSDLAGPNGIEPFVPYTTQKGLDQVVEMIKKGETSQSQVVFDFEDRFKKFVGTEYSRAFCNGTAAILCGLYGLGLGEGDEVLVPSYTFFASATPITAVGATPVFCEVDPDTLCIDPEDIKRKLTPKTRGIVVVHTYGNPADMDAIMAIAKAHDIKVLEDCSHAHGAIYKGRQVGSIGDVGAFSLQASKIFYGGEAGILTTNNRDVYERAVAYSTYETASKFPDDSPYKKYRFTAMGQHLRVHPVAIAIADDCMDHFEERCRIRNENGKYLDSLLADLSFIVPQRVYEGGERQYAYHLARLESDKLHGICRSVFLKALAAEGVYCGDSAYGKVHLEPFFTEGDFLKKSFVPKNAPQSLPVSESLSETTFMVAPRFENPDCRAMLDEYSIAYHKVAENYEELLQFQKEHEAELGDLIPKSARSVNKVD